MQPQDEARFSIAELVDATGLTERTIRYYIQEGLVPAALGRGRSRYYTPQHLETLTRIADLRRQRLSIEEIRERVAVPPARSAEPEDAGVEHWQRINLHPDLELLVRADAPESIRALARDLRQRAHEWFGDEVY
jgi:DNA-binding transcriptional MerR regulator